MKTFFLSAFLVLTAAVLFLTTSTSAATDFSGTWSLNVSKSKNIGMMSTMQITLKIKQTESELVVSEVAKFNGQEQSRELHYELSGKESPNAGPMGDPNQTVTKWTGSTLETAWTQDGAVAGTKVVRTETRSVSADGKTMSDEFVRGPNPPMVLVFDKQ
jgi:preprotein translocase subunit SecF